MLHATPPMGLEAQLARLLQAAFTADELYAFLRHHIGGDFADALPDPRAVGLAAYAARVAERLCKHRMVTREFIESCVAAAPSYAGEFRALLDLLPPSGDGVGEPPAGDGVGEPPLGALWYVPELPAHYQERDEQSAVIDALIGADSVGDDESTPQDGSSERSCMLGVHGMGGVGKSVLAAAVVRSEAVRARFADGVFWLMLGQNPEIERLQGQLVRALSAEADAGRAIADAGTGEMKLEQLLAGKRALLVLDDVWDADHAQAFQVLELPGRTLLTTRVLEVITWLGAAELCVDVLPLDQALRLLAQWVGVRSPDSLPPVAAQVAEACGCLPLALATVGALVRNRKASWDKTLGWLRDADLAKLRGHIPAYPYRNVLAAIEVSVEALDDALGDYFGRAAARRGSGDPASARRCYLDLAVFPEDTAIPRSALRALWSRRGLDADDADLLAGELVTHALASAQGQGGETRLRLHDLQRAYVRSQQAEAALSALHGELVDAYAARCAGEFGAGPDDGYMFQRLPYHLAQAGREEALRALLADYAWLHGKLRATEPAELIADYSYAGVDGAATDETTRALRLIRDALRLSSHVLARDGEQLPGQLVGRLTGFESEAGVVARLLTSARADRRRAWLCPLVANLTAPGGPLVRTLSGHLSYVKGVALTADGARAVSASSDGTLKVWDVDTGQPLHTLTDHDNDVTGVALSIDGAVAVSASKDHTLKVWDVASGRALHTLSGHTSAVTGVALSADGAVAVSASYDATLKVWDARAGRELRALVGHGEEVIGVAVSADGAVAVSASKDGLLKVWDVASGRELRSMWGHSDWVTAVAVSADGAVAVSGSQDCTLKVWDAGSGRQLRSLSGHTSFVNAVALTADGARAVSASRDCTLRVWEVASGRELRSLSGHTDDVTGVALTADGARAVSASFDQTLKVWDLEAKLDRRALSGHTRSVTGVALTADGAQVVSASWDETLRVWDVASGRALRTLWGHFKPVAAVTLTAGGAQAVSASWDETLRVWDVASGQTLRSLVGHADVVTDVALTADGALAVSASKDATLRVWDVASGQELRALLGHAFEVTAVALAANGSLAVSASCDETLRVWDVASGEALRTLSGHTSTVTGVALSADGTRAVSASRDNMLKVWDVKAGQEIKTLAGHTFVVSAVAVTPDGALAVSVSMDHTLKVWDVARGAEIASFVADAPMISCAASPDGRVLVAGDERGGVHVLRLVEPDATV